MIKVKEYRGHIRNWEALCHELEIYEALGGAGTDWVDDANMEANGDGVMAASISAVSNDSKRMTR